MQWPLLGESPTQVGNAITGFFKLIGADTLAAGFENANKRIIAGFNYLQIPVKKATESVKNFNKEVAKSANATIKPKTETKATGKGDDKIDDVYKDLAVKLKQIDAEFGATFDDKATNRIKAYQNAINSLIENGVNPLSDSIKNLQDLQQNNNLLKLPKDFSNQVSKDKSPTAKIQLPKLAKIGVDKELQKETKAMLQTAANFNNQFSNAITDGLANGIGDAFSAIGEAFANGGNVFEAMGKSLLGAFGNFLGQFGDLLIQYGTAALIKSKLDLAIAIPGAGLLVAGLAIAAGAALKIAAGAFSGLTKGDKKGSSSPRAFAKGGIVSSPTNAIFGEYPSAGRGNPEVVAPLNSLKGMLGEMGGGGYGEVTFRIQGDTLVGVLSNHQKRQFRTS
ncbi:hypothetical protein [Pedobacter sp.]|uniref:hypothetical protein n=1 Tax=Pedobacter sp. TaxID=1411316 RepID=UPI003BAA59DC